MEIICERENMHRALKRVRSNKGAPGVDGMTVDQLPSYMRKHWPQIKEELLKGTYRPFPVRRKEIQKPQGGVRLLGIPSILDRVIQQAITQVIEPHFDYHFSESSFGFRPNRSAHGANRRVQTFIKEGRKIAVDADLAKFRMMFLWQEFSAG
ncbi:MAG: maturase [Desulfobulbaceae bacterium]|nr:maturase [Desulfobulbaceae bacterium]